MKKIYKKNQNGASMLEVMIALLIMSLGLLGMAGLQAATAKYRVNIQSNAAVAQLVSELSERVRINSDATGPSFDPSMGGAVSKYVLTDTWAAQQQAPLAIAKDCLANVCTSDERAAFDMTSWRMRVRNLLPQGAALVQGDKKSGIDTTLMWMDKEQTKETLDSTTGELQRSLSKATACTADADNTIVHNCCPDLAEAPAGVRCLRMSFLP